MGAALNNIYARNLRPKVFGPHATPTELEAEIQTWLTNADNEELKVVFIEYGAVSGEYSALLLYSE